MDLLLGFWSKMDNTRSANTGAVIPIECFKSNILERIKKHFKRDQ